MSQDGWRYQLCGTEFGPVSFDALAEMAERGTLGADDLVIGPKGNWKPAGEIVGLIPEKPETASPIDIGFELPSIAQETPRARVVAPKDANSLDTLGPKRESTVGPKSLPNSPPKKSKPLPKPESMKDAISSMLSGADDAAPEEFGNESHLSPQRGVPQKSAFGGPETPAAKAPAASTPEPQSFDTPPENEPTPEPAASESPQFDPPTPPRPKPPVSIPKSKSKGGSSLSLDPELVQKGGIGLGALAAVAAIWFFVVPMFSGSSARSGGNIVERQWKSTDRMVTSLVSLIDSANKDALPGLEPILRSQSRDQVSILEGVKSGGSNPDPPLTDALLDIHQNAIPPLLTADGWTPENINKLKEAHNAAKDLAEG